MSLFLLGSCSRITSSIVQHLASQNIYRRIIIGDLLPSYSLFRRYYALRDQLSRVSTQTSVDILKLTTRQTINENIAQASDVLFITHDYAKNVMSKTALVKEVAEDAKHSEGKTILYVAPAEYDSYFFKDPYRQYLNGQTVLKRKLPNVNIIRTDIVENGEYHQYYNDVVVGSASFKALSKIRDLKVVRSKTLNDEVTRILTQKPSGESVLLKGDALINQLPSPPRFPEVLDPIERILDTWGMKSNLAQLTKMDLNELHTLLTGGFSPSKP